MVPWLVSDLDFGERCDDTEEQLTILCYYAGVELEIHDKV